MALAAKAPLQPATPSSDPKPDALCLLATAACDPEAVQAHSARPYFPIPAASVKQPDPDRPLTRWLTCEEEFQRITQQEAERAAQKEAAAAEKAAKHTAREAARDAAVAAKEAADDAKYVHSGVIHRFFSALLARSDGEKDAPSGAAVERAEECRKARAAALERRARRRSGAVPVQTVQPVPAPVVIVAPPPPAPVTNKRARVAPGRMDL